MADNRASAVVRPSPANRGTGSPLGHLAKSPVLLTVAAIVLLFIARALAQGNALIQWLLIGGALGGAAIWARYRLVLANVSLYVRDGQLGKTNFLGSRTEVPLEDAASIRLCSVVSPAGSYVQPYLLVLSKDGSCLLSLPTSNLFSLTDIREVARAAGIEVSGTWDDRVDLQDLNHRYPGSVSTTARWLAGDFKHPRLAGVVIVTIILLLMAIVIGFTIVRSR